MRDFTFVDDVVAANLAAAAAEAAPTDPVNVAGGSSTTLLELVNIVGDAVGQPVPVEWLPAQPGDVARTGGDVQRAASLLGWSPAVTLEQGVARQVEWHRATLV